MPAKNLFEEADYQHGQHVRTQVCVIGTGCGGATLAKRLSDFGIEVIMLEQGGFYPASKMDQNELNMTGKLVGERGLDTSHDSGNALVYGNNVGGASVHYWADSYRTPEEKLHSWEQEFGLKGHAAADLAPAFEAIEAALHVHPAQDPYFNNMNLKFREASQSLNWHGHRVPQARKHCQKSGHCMQGCLYDAKQSQIVTHIPTALKQGARLFADARAGKLIHRNNRVSELTVDVMSRAENRPSGKQFRISADVFVVAAGGFSSSFYLMKQGFKSNLPALGRYFSMNPSTMVHALFDEEIVQWRNIPAAWGVDAYRLRRYKNQSYVEGGYLLMPNQLQPGALAAMIPGFGRDHRQWMENLPKVGGSIAWIDDVEQELGEIRVKGNGAREVYYPYGELTQKILRDSIKKQVILNFEAGARRVLVAGLQGIRLQSLDELHKLDALNIEAGGLTMASPHPGGGCRMGADPKNSVVHFDHRVHGWDNLYVSDSSVFPSSSSLDPSLTIMAFSYIAAGHIREKLAA